MSDEKDAQPKSDNKLKIFHKEYDVALIKFDGNSDDIKDNDTNVKLFQVILTDKCTVNKHQIYNKIFYKKDCDNIRNKAGLLMMKNDKFVELLLYCLSNKNNKYNVNYKVIKKGDVLSGITINITFGDSGWIVYNIELFIPIKKMTDIELMRLRLNEYEAENKALKDSLKILANKVAELEKSRYNIPVLFREMIDKDVSRQSGWNVIKLNYSDSKDDDISLNQNAGSVILKPNTYVVQATCNVYDGYNSCISLQNTNQSIVVYGNIGRSCNYNSESMASLIILPQKIVINTTTEVFFKLFCSSGGGSSGMKTGSIKLMNGKCFVAQLSIQKV